MTMKISNSHNMNYDSYSDGYNHDNNNDDNQ